MKKSKEMKPKPYFFDSLRIHQIAASGTMIGNRIYTLMIFQEIRADEITFQALAYSLVRFI